jgi:hypothetical protein
MLDAGCWMLGFEPHPSIQHPASSIFFIVSGCRKAICMTPQKVVFSSQFSVFGNLQTETCKNKNK